MSDQPKAQSAHDAHEVSARRAADASASQHSTATVDSYPLLPTDPPKIGDWWLDARLVARTSGVAFLGHASPVSTNSETPVMVVMLSQGAADDAAARDRFAGEINKMSEETVLARGGNGQNEGRLGHLYMAEDEALLEPGAPVSAPWTVLAWDGSAAALSEADRILRSVDLSNTSQLGRAAGPTFSLPWASQSQPGRWRLWPLNWPGRNDRASWASTLASWFLVVLLGSTALLIAALIFQNPPMSGGGGGGGGQQTASPSPATASPSPGGTPSPSGTEPASPSETSGSPSEHASPTKTPSMNATGQGTPTATNTPTSQSTRL